MVHFKGFLSMNEITAFGRDEVEVGVWDLPPL